MSYYDIALGIIIGILIGAYGAWLGHDTIVIGKEMLQAKVDYLNRQEAKAKEEAEARNQEAPANPQSAETQTNSRPPQEEPTQETTPTTTP